jgi:hypothetical protein
MNIITTKDTWVFARKYFDKEAIVCINNSAQPKTIEVEIPAILNIKNLKSSFNNKFVISNHKITIQLPAYGADILL